MEDMSKMKMVRSFGLGLACVFASAVLLASCASTGGGDLGSDSVAGMLEEEEGDSAAAGGDGSGKAYLIGAIGGDQNWNPGENAGAAVTEISGDGQYTVTWNLTGGKQDTGGSWFLAVCIAPGDGSPNFSTTTYPNLGITVDEVLINGAVPEGYGTSGTAINLAYTEGGPEVSRIYLHDDWAGTGINDVKNGEIESVSVTFTISGVSQ